MKKLFIAPLMIVFIVLIFTSCETKNNKTNESVPPTEKIEYNSTNPGNIQSVPEEEVSPPAEPEQEKPASPEPKPAPAPVPKKEPVKKTAPKPLGSYSTPLLNRNKDRVYNIKLAAKKINDYKLNPGETFSFNGTVGKRDEESGFRKAAIIVNGEYDEDMGGGVCQLSSTIFNAANKAGLEIVERHSHSKSVKYVSEGRDAAVSYDYLDLKFKNNKKYPVKIKVSVENKKVSVSIWKSK